VSHTPRLLLLQTARLETGVDLSFFLSTRVRGRPVCSPACQAAGALRHAAFEPQGTGTRKPPGTGTHKPTRNGADCNPAKQPCTAVLSPSHASCPVSRRRVGTGEAAAPAAADAPTPEPAPQPPSPSAGAQPHSAPEAPCAATSAEPASPAARAPAQLAVDTVQAGACGAGGVTTPNDAAASASADSGTPPTVQPLPQRLMQALAAAGPQQLGPLPGSASAAPGTPDDGPPPSPGVLVLGPSCTHPDAPVIIMAGGAG
jgi:hypothetical protein